MIAVTGATGKLGQHVISQLIAKVPPSQVIAAVRSPEKAEALRAKGVQIREANYDRPETLEKALAGVETLLLISANEVGKRFPQHQAVIAAARKSGVKRIVYTSILGADSTRMGLGKEHKATEEAIRASGIPFTFLRNGWYLENYTENLAPALQYGAIMGATQGGRVGAATREDYAAAAVAVLTQPGHENKTYELAADEAFTMDELAAEVARASGKKVVYKDLPEAAYKQALLGAGLPEVFASMLSDSDVGIGRGELVSRSGDLRRLIGRSATSLPRAVAAAVSGR